MTGFITTEDDKDPSTIFVRVDHAAAALANHYLVRSQHIGRGMISATCNCGEDFPLFPAMGPPDQQNTGPSRAIGPHLEQVMKNLPNRLHLDAMSTPSLGTQE